MDATLHTLQSLLERVVAFAGSGLGVLITLLAAVVAAHEANKAASLAAELLQKVKDLERRLDDIKAQTNDIKAHTAAIMREG